MQKECARRRWQNKQGCSHALAFWRAPHRSCFQCRPTRSAGPSRQRHPSDLLWASVGDPELPRLSFSGVPNSTAIRGVPNFQADWQLAGKSFTCRPPCLPLAFSGLLPQWQLLRRRRRLLIPRRSLILGGIVMGPAGRAVAALLLRCSAGCPIVPKRVCSGFPLLSSVFLPLLRSVAPLLREAADVAKFAAFHRSVAPSRAPLRCPVWDRAQCQIFPKTVKVQSNSITRPVGGRAMHWAVFCSTQQLQFSSLPLVRLACLVRPLCCLHRLAFLCCLHSLFSPLQCASIVPVLLPCSSCSFLAGPVPGASLLPRSAGVLRPSFGLRWRKGGLEPAFRPNLLAPPASVRPLLLAGMLFPACISTPPAFHHPC